MKDLRTFNFDRYELDVDAKSIRLFYSFEGGPSFVELIRLPPGEWVEGIVGSDRLEAALFALHLVGGISYYKAALSPTIAVKSGSLTKDQAALWDEVYVNGLGELLYKNSIDPKRVAQFPFDEQKTVSVSTEERHSNGTYLVPFGGGKDSVVSVELLRKANAKMVLYRNNHHRIIDELAEVAGLPLVETVRRLDPKLFELNAQGAINGHIPITAYLSFLTIVVALLYGYNGVVWSNERSANFGNVTFFDREINHQWSKSVEAEELIRKYVATFIDPSVEYLDVLRPLSELHIAQLYAQYPQYFQLATSCNRNWTLAQSPDMGNRVWCGNCAKCAFSFLLFTAFLPLERVTSMIGQNLLNKTALLPVFFELAGLDGIKPFDCVGTPDEVRAALILAGTQEEVRQTEVWKQLSQRLSLDADESLITSLMTPELGDSVPQRVSDWLAASLV